MAIQGESQQVSNARPKEDECTSLITRMLKLRWIGMEDEAKHLQTKLERIPSNLRSSVLAGPHATD